MKLEELRQELSPKKFIYHLIDEDGQSHWLNISQLEERKEAVLTRKAISLRLNHMFARKNTQFQTIMDCISIPRGDTRKGILDIDVSKALKIMNDNLRKKLTT